MTETIRIEYMALTDLAKRMWSDNPKDHDLGVLHGSFEDYGYVDPILINEASGELLKGHGRVQTAMQRKAAGDPPPERVRVRDGEWYLPVVRGISMDPDTGHKYAIMDNRSTELGGWQEQKLGEVLAQMAAEGEVESTGFDEDDVDRILQDLRPVDYSDFEEEMEDLEGLEDVRITIVVPKKYETEVKHWLSNGEQLTGPGMGKGVLLRCGLL
jgi:hypothetical protein